MLSNLKIPRPRYFPESTLKEISELTEANNHNDAVLVLAQVLQNKKGIDIMLALSAICKEYGETPKPLIEIRSEVLNELLRFANAYYDSDIEEIENAF